MRHPFAIRAIYSFKAETNNDYNFEDTFDEAEVRYESINDDDDYPDDCTGDNDDSQMRQEQFDETEDGKYFSQAAKNLKKQEVGNDKGMPWNIFVKRIQSEYLTTKKVPRDNDILQELV